MSHTKVFFDMDGDKASLRYELLAGPPGAEGNEEAIAFSIHVQSSSVPRDAIAYFDPALWSALNGCQVSERVTGPEVQARQSSDPHAPEGETDISMAVAIPLERDRSASNSWQGMMTCFMSASDLWHRRASDLVVADPEVGVFLSSESASASVEVDNNVQETEGLSPDGVATNGTEVMRNGSTFHWVTSDSSKALAVIASSSMEFTTDSLQDWRAAALILLGILASTVVALAGALVSEILDRPPRRYPDGR